MEDENVSPDTPDNVLGDLRTTDVQTSEEKDLSHLDFSQSIEELKETAAAKGSGKTEAFLTPEEEITTSTYMIGDHEFYLSSILEWKMKQDEDFCKLVPLVLPAVELFTALFQKQTAQSEYAAKITEIQRQYLFDVEAEHAVAAAEEREPDDVPIPKLPSAPEEVTVDEMKTLVQTVMRCIVESNAHRTLLAIAYVPVGERYDRDRTAEIEEIMGDATNADLIRCIQRFFTIGNG